MSEMVEVKTEELEGAALNFCVGKASGIKVEVSRRFGVTSILGNKPKLGSYWEPSRDWEQGGPLIERERISLSGPGCMGGPKERLWSASIDTGSFAGSRSYSGPTPLVAACRCLVGLEMGEKVQVPKELMQ